MCKEQVSPEDCYEYLIEIEDAIQRLYINIDHFLFQDIDKAKIQNILPRWVCDGGRTPEVSLSKAMYEKCRQKCDMPIVRKFIYYYDLWNIIAAIQDRFEAVSIFMRDFYQYIPFEVKYQEQKYTSIVRNSGNRETDAHIYINGVFIALASTFDLLSKIAIEQAQYNKYGDFSSYSNMVSSGKDGLYNVQKLRNYINPELTKEGMLFSTNKEVRMIETFRNEYVHNGPWDLCNSVYCTAINEEPADVILFAPDIDDNGNFVSSGARNKFYSQGNMMNVMLPGLVKSVFEILRRTIDCLASLYNTATTQTPDKEKTELAVKGIDDLLRKLEYPNNNSSSTSVSGESLDMQ